MLKTVLQQVFGNREGNVDREMASTEAEHCTPRVLNVGGNNKKIQIPACFAGWEHVLLDIDPKGSPDIVCDARRMLTLPPSQFDAVYCSHNLEHYYKHDGI